MILHNTLNLHRPIFENCSRTSLDLNTTRKLAKNPIRATLQVVVKMTTHQYSE